MIKGNLKKHRISFTNDFTYATFLNVRITETENRLMLGQSLGMGVGMHKWRGNVLEEVGVPMEGSNHGSLW